jgi:hypothetical protein
VLPKRSKDLIDRSSALGIDNRAPAWPGNRGEPATDDLDSVEDQAAAAKNP